MATITRKAYTAEQFENITKGAVLLDGTVDTELVVPAVDDTLGNTVFAVDGVPVIYIRHSTISVRATPKSNYSLINWKAIEAEKGFLLVTIKF